MSTILTLSLAGLSGCSSVNSAVQSDIEAENQRSSWSRLLDSVSPREKPPEARDSAMEKMRLIFEASDAPTVMATRGRTALAGGCAHADGSKDWGVLFFYPSINGTTTAVLKGLTGEFRHGKSPRKMAFEELRYLQEYYKTESQQCSRLFETYPEGAPYQEILSGWADHSLYFACQNQAAGPLDYANYRLRMIDRAGELSWSLEVTCGNPAGCRSRQGQMRFMEVEAFCLFKTGSGD